MRCLVLFDIDGTLLHGGPARGAFETAMVEVFGTAGPIEAWEFSGKTDPQIARELLTSAGIEEERIEAGLPRLWSRYLDEMEARLLTQPTLTLPGVAELLHDLESLGDVGLGLVTGNLMDGARLKLASVGLQSHFPVGAFGSDREVRNELPGIAVERARRHWRRDFAPGEVVVVGDTPRDVDCGKFFGTRTVAVATGNFDLESLHATGADAVLANFGRTDLAIQAILHEGDGSGVGRDRSSEPAQGYS